MCYDNAPDAPFDKECFLDAISFIQGVDVNLRHFDINLREFYKEVEGGVHNDHTILAVQSFMESRLKSLYSENASYPESSKIYSV